MVLSLQINHEREDHIINFYQNLYSVPDNTPVDFTDSVRVFLGNLTEHPVLRSFVLTEREREELEQLVTLKELDDAVGASNMNSAPGIDGVSNRFLKKFGILLREPLLM